MATLGCTNPSAVNYNPAATQDDGSCVYLSSVGGTCYQFNDLDPSELVDRSFTLSHSIEGDNWVFYHDYIPDMYFSTREQLHVLKNNQIYHMNQGSPGRYFNTEDIKSFFIDVVARSADEMALNTVKWISEVFDRQGVAKEFSTLTHITIWNSYQCTGRIPLADNFELLEYKNKRRTMAQWSFNNFRDLLISRGIPFLKDIFSNFAVIDGTIDQSKPWFEQMLMEDEFFVIRFEFDNTSGDTIFLHDTDGDTTQSYR